MSNSSEILSHEVQRVVHDPKRSSFEKYCLLVIGEKSLGRLLAYECLTGLFGSCPGAAGYVLRQMFYRPLFAKLGRGVTIGRHCTFRGIGRITLDDGVMLDDNVVIDARGAQASISIGKGVFVGRNTVIRCRGERMEIGEGTDIGCNCLVATDSRLEVGRDCIIAAYTYIAAGGQHRYDDKTIPMKEQGFDKKGGSRLADDVWIGAHSSVHDGVMIGKGAIIGAHSMVNKSIPEYAIAWGVPATVQKSR